MLEVGKNIRFDRIQKNTKQSLKFQVEAMTWKKKVRSNFLDVEKQDADVMTSTWAI